MIIIISLLGQWIEITLVVVELLVELLQEQILLQQDIIVVVVIVVVVVIILVEDLQLDRYLWIIQFNILIIKWKNSNLEVINGVNKNWQPTINNQQQINK